MVGADLCADIEERIVGDAEFDNARLRLDLGFAEGGPLRFRDILRFRLSGAKLDGGVAVTVSLAAADDLKLVQLQNGNGHVPTIRLEQAGHSDLLRDHAGAHDQNSSYR